MSHPSTQGTRTRWAVEETGSHSVTPWTAPRRIPWRTVTAGVVAPAARRLPGFHAGRDQAPLVPAPELPPEDEEEVEVRRAAGPADHGGGVRRGPGGESPTDGPPGRSLPGRVRPGATASAATRRHA